MPSKGDNAPVRNGELSPMEGELNILVYKLQTCQYESNTKRTDEVNK